jgi:hypothetical protein
MARASAVLLAGVLVTSTALAQEQRRQPNTHGPSALETHAARIEHDAVEDLKTGPAGFPWFVDLDVVFPTDGAEYQALGKYAILVFALFSNDQTELPLARAYVGDVPLKCLGPVSRGVPPESATAKAYGKFRADTLCVLPIGVKRKGSDIKVDFAKNRKGLAISSSLFEEPDFIKADIDPQSLSEADPITLEKIIAREYPGFGFRVRP